MLIERKVGIERGEDKGLRVGLEPGPTALQPYSIFVTCHYLGLHLLEQYIYIYLFLH